MTDTLPLAGVRVVDLSDGVAGAYGTKLLADWGADVIKVELPAGDPTRRLGPRTGDHPDDSVLFAWLNTGKRSVVIDLAAAAGLEQLSTLLDSANLIVESGHPGHWAALGLDFAALRQRRAELVVCSVTPFGQDGPRAHWRTTALTAFASGGQMSLCGDEDKPPLKTAGFQAEYQGGLHVFASSITALFAARRTGRGEHIDLSLQEVQAACLENAGPVAMVRGTDNARTGNQLRATWGIYPSADGYVGVAAMARQTAAVYECIGHPELAEDPAFLNLLINPDGNDVVEAFISEWTAAHTSAEIFAESGQHRAPFSLVATARELLDSEALREAGFWREVEHPRFGRHVVPGPAFSIGEATGEVRRAPLLGEHTDEVLSSLAPAQPSPRATSEARPLLHGVRVLDLTQVWAGPYATRFLADMGADVIHIEGPAFADAVRGVGRGGEDRPYDRSVYFNEYNRNKRGLVMDLHDERGLAAFRRMVAKSDVVIENWSAGVAGRLGIGYEDLRAINPRIIFVQMPAFGISGPDAGRVGFGPSIEQMGGLVALQGYEGGPPHRSGISYGDPNAGVAAAGATALALYQREITGEGSHVVLRQRDNIVGMVGEFMIAAALGIPCATQTGNRDTSMAPHGVYRCRDTEPRILADAIGNPIREVSEDWVAITVESDAAWSSLVRVSGDSRLAREEWASSEGRLAAHDELDAILGEWTVTRSAVDVAEGLQDAGVSAAPVLSPLQVVRDEHLAARNTFTTYDHPVAGVCGTMRPAWRLTDRPFEGVSAAPTFGQHNREVLAEVAGLAAAEIEALEAAGVLATEPRL